MSAKAEPFLMARSSGVLVSRAKSGCSPLLCNEWPKQIHLSSPRDRDGSQRSSEDNERARHRASPRRRIATTPRARSASHVLHTRMAIRRREHRRVDIDSIDSACLRARWEGEGGGGGDSGVGAGEEDEREAWGGHGYGTYVRRSVAWDRRHVQRTREPSVRLKVITEGLFA
jgi:hypothetical protein